MPASSHASDFDIESPRCSDASTSVPDWPPEPRLRGLRWRVLLGVLPSCPAPIESLRRAAANGRRRYAELRRRLIVDPYIMDDVQKGENLVVNNPLSQDPDSVWGHYFKNAELERTIDNDLTRLYPEHGSFFQSYACQAMLKRTLLVWALSNPHHGYRQGMHEVLAPLVYVLHLDFTHLSQVKQHYEDAFDDRFDTPVEEKREVKQVMASFCPRQALQVSSNTSEEEEWIRRVHPDDLALVEPDDFGFNLKTMLLGSDSYGAEGELGALLSGRFLEHDAYCMFNALMTGEGGSMALADYFLAVNEGAMGVSSVLDAFTAMYNTLAVIDAPLYTHLVEVGVEPQYFALRWFRVLFGREFDLEMLLHLWDAIFAASYATSLDGDAGRSSMSSARVAFISTFAVSMILYLRPTLLAAPDATVCLQKLLTFPKQIDVRKLIENARVLQMVLEGPSKTPLSFAGKHAQFIERSNRGNRHKNGPTSPSIHARGLQHGSPELSQHHRTESYWEEKWMSSVLPEDLSKATDVAAGAKESGSESCNVSGHSIAGGVEALSGLEDRTSKESVQSKGAPSAELKSKPARRSLFANFWKSAAQLMSFDDRKEVLSETSPENAATSSNTAVAASNTEGVNKLEDHGETSNNAGPNAGPEGLVEGHSRSGERVAASVIWTSDDGETSCSGDDEVKSHTSCGTLDHATDATSDKSPTHPLEDEVECLRPSDGCVESCGQSEAGPTNRDKEISMLPDLMEENGGADTLHDLKNEKGTFEVTNGKRSRATLQTLGHSMAESIQVIESALSGLAKEGAPMGYRETAENISRALLNGKGHLTALSALAELRKISSLLLQM